MNPKRKEIWSWTMYDWANSAFVTTILAAVLPIYYINVAGSGLEKGQATQYWGYTQSFAALLIVFLAPILGAIADYSSSKMKFLRFFAYMGMIASVLLAFVGEGDYLLASLIVIVGSIGFSGGNSFYDAFLPDIASNKEIDRISARGYAFGYIGGGILLLINLTMIMKYEWFNLANSTIATQLAFVTVGIWWFVFSIPMFKNVKERKNVVEKMSGSYVSIGFKRVINTFKDIKQYKQVLIFLLAFWLYNDGISTIIKMATIYGAEIGIGTTELISALLITQFVGIPCAFFFGWLAQKIKPKKALYIALWLYVFIVLLGYFMTTATHFYILAICVGLVQGGAQAISRSIFGSMVPKSKRAEFFGFYGISAKFSAVFGPAALAYVGYLTGSNRLGILLLIVFFLVGIFILSKVDIEKGKEEALNAN
jgi:MFS transporter, UMF1 family